MSPHLIIIFLLFVIVGILVSEQYNFEYFRFEHIHFMSKKELQNFFRNDPDGYFKSFNEINLKAYGYKTIQAYVDAAIKDADDFTEQEKEYLTKEMN